MIDGLDFTRGTEVRLTVVVVGPAAGDRPSGNGGCAEEAVSSLLLLGAGTHTHLVAQS